MSISVSNLAASGEAYEAMDAETVAALLGVGERQLRNYINLKGLPCQGEGRRRTFIWHQVREWYVGYRIQLEMEGGNGGNDLAENDDSTSETGPRGKEDIRQATLRSKIAEANLRELNLSKQRGEVVTIADAKEKLDRMLGNLRARLLGIAPKLSARLDGTRDRNAREAAIKDEMETLCRELSTGAIVAAPDAPAADDTDVVDDITAAADEGITDAEQADAGAQLEAAYDSLER